MNDPHDNVILLVEDNPDDAEITQRALLRDNIVTRVVWAKDGARALEALFAPGARLPQLVLLDLKLPRIDGHEVLRAIRADPRTRLLPVVMLTSSTQDTDVVHSYDLGVNSFVSKPVQFERFAEVVGRLALYWLLVNRPAPH